MNQAFLDRIPYYQQMSGWVTVLKYLFGTVVAAIVTFLMIQEAEILLLGALVIAFFGVLFALRTVGEIVSNLGGFPD